MKTIYFLDWLKDQGIDPQKFLDGAKATFNDELYPAAKDLFNKLPVSEWVSNSIDINNFSEFFKEQTGDKVEAFELFGEIVDKWDDVLENDNFKIVFSRKKINGWVIEDQGDKMNLFLNDILNGYEDDLKTWVFLRLQRKIKIHEEKFNDFWKIYKSLPNFKISENISEQSEIFKNLEIEEKEIIQNIVRLTTQFFLEKAFEANKIDLDDPNVTEDLVNGNIGTPGRIAKMWTGANQEDDTELMSGRWIKAPRLATFPNEKKVNIPITKKVAINAVCSHHTAIFSTLWGEGSYAIISYIPDEFQLGISKLQRITDWVARRGWLQEDLTKELYNIVSTAAQTDSVYVKLVNVVHSCELNRGAQTQDAGFTTEFWGGLFNDKEYREIVNKDY